MNFAEYTNTLKLAESVCHCRAAVLELTIPGVGCLRFRQYSDQGISNMNFCLASFAGISDGIYVFIYVFGRMSLIYCDVLL